MDNRTETRKQNSADAKMNRALTAKDEALLGAAQATQARLAFGHQENEKEALANRVKTQRARREDLASRFVEIEDMENLIKARGQDPEGFNRVMDPTTRMSLGMYEEMRNAAKRKGEFSPEAIEALEHQILLEKALDHLKTTARGD